MSITIVICTHDRASSLESALQSLTRVERPERNDIDLLVVANACSDHTPALLNHLAREGLANGVPCRWLEEPRPGKSFALNRAIAETDADALCFIDDDQLVEEGFLEALSQGVAAYPDHEIICGKMRPAWDGSEPAWVHETGHYQIPIRPFPEFDFGDAPQDVDPAVKLPSGGNITVRRSVFSTAGTFSTQIGPAGHNLKGGEDLEFLRRCVASGARIRYVPSIRQLHTIEPSRMAMGYMIRKSYWRSLSSILISDKPLDRLRPYMITKPVRLAVLALFSLRQNRRFYYLIRTASALGELHATMSLQFGRAK